MIYKHFYLQGSNCIEGQYNLLPGDIFIIRYVMAFDRKNSRLSFWNTSDIYFSRLIIVFIYKENLINFRCNGTRRTFKSYHSGTVYNSVKPNYGKLRTFIRKCKKLFVGLPGPPVVGSHLHLVFVICLDIISKDKNNPLIKEGMMRRHLRRKRGHSLAFLFLSVWDSWQWDKSWPRFILSRVWTLFGDTATENRLSKWRPTLTSH